MPPRIRLSTPTFGSGWRIGPLNGGNGSGPAPFTRARQVPISKTRFSRVVQSTARQATLQTLKEDGYCFLPGRPYPARLRPSERTCTVPPGVSLFFPLLNQEYDNVGCCDPGTPPFQFTVEELKSLLAAAMDSPQELHASVDGVPVPAYVLKSEVFAYQMPATDNVYQYFGAKVPGVNWPSTTAVSDGYWALVRPLSRGRIQSSSRYHEHGFHCRRHVPHHRRT